MPYPRSYTTVPFRLIARLQPGESDLSHSAKSLSTLAVKDWADNEFSLVEAGSLARADNARSKTLPIMVLTMNQRAFANVFMINVVPVRKGIDGTVFRQ